MKNHDIKIAQIILEKGMTATNHGLMNGNTGICIFLYHFSKNTNNPDFEKIADDLLDKIFDNLMGKWGQTLFLKYWCLNPLILLLKTSFFDHFLIIPGTLSDHLQTIYRQLVDTRPM